MTAKDVLKLAREKGAKIVDLRFVDVPGHWQHFSIPASELKEELFTEGIGFDGSSIRGFQTIDESDMLLMPDPSSAQMDPFTSVPTLVLICNVKDPVTMEAYTRDPRYVAQKAEMFLKQTGIADTVYICLLYTSPSGCPGSGPWGPPGSSPACSGGGSPAPPCRSSRSRPRSPGGRSRSCTPGRTSPSPG